MAATPGKSDKIGGHRVERCDFDSGVFQPLVLPWSTHFSH
jgi:hypothetical protein